MALKIWAKNWVRDGGWRRENPWNGEGGSTNQEGFEEIKSREEEDEDWGANCPIILNRTYMTINKNSNASSASQLSIYVQNVRSLGVQINSNKFTRPIDQGCDIYIFVDARVNEPKMRQLWANFKVRTSNI